MFFDDLTKIPSIAEGVGFSIFVVPSEMIDSLNTGKKQVKTATKIAVPDFPVTTFYLEPDEKDSVKVNKIRDLESELSNKQTSARFFIIKHAETMNEAAQNAALKLLEEPKENCHLVFLATSLTSFLQTVLSRANVYILRVEDPLGKSPVVSEEILNNAKLLLAASPAKTLSLVEQWTTKTTKKTRLEIVQILNTTVELAYKSYFKTENSAFLKKIPSLITACENIKANGHIKLQLVAHLC